MAAVLPPDRKAVRHTKPRFRLRARIGAVKRRRKGVEFLAGLSPNTFFFFKKRNPVESKRFKNEDLESPSDADD
jgi:hypothetical protein